VLTVPSVSVNDDPIKSESLSTGLDSQIEIITVRGLDRFRSRLSFTCGFTKAVAIIGIQVQMLTTDTTTIARSLLSFGMILELVSIFISICFIQSRRSDAAQVPSTFVRLLARVPSILILAGIVVLGAALVVEMFEVSMGAAIAMSALLVCGVLVCLLAVYRG